MTYARRAALCAVGLASALALTACNGSGTSASADGPQKVADTKGSGKTLTVWVMQDDYSDESLAAINKEFTEKTGAEVKLETQSWDGITTKITTALATDTPPDVIDIGNTQVAGFAASGGLMDLTSYAKDLRQGEDWLPGLEDPATVDRKLYGVPGFAAARAVIYNKTIWKKAGVTTEPKTYEELTAALDKIKAANTVSDFSAFYLPGQDWYTGLQFVWDKNGEIATEDSGKWTAGMSSAQAQEGLAQYKRFQNTYSRTSSRTADKVSPDQMQVFADGKAGAFVATSAQVNQIKQANPKIKDADLGTFPLPNSKGEAQPVMLGGAVWGVAAKSKQQNLALQWTKIAASPDIQSKWIFGHDGWNPNSTVGNVKAETSVPAVLKGFFEGARNTRATPASAQWTVLEADKSINKLFSDVASGKKTTAQAAKAFDAATDKALNAAG
ncbi:MULTISPECIES: extracellular solute-binding protein [unclassified Streptomyces]|uniref:extracellular solute-binding protein n=1 Tax=unclassified Streptomyces TaxID=2593676 RepID=UPI002E2C43A5|nr:extracellular solute-binding protein [Streptomyces sp. NBC_01423]WSX89093.1 extracellular solute-binding protein [Streptomyces sp. NBC_00891]WSY03572.1 extracellular solute-binding protein [Streptomyces sp. NBC_00890]WSZ05199.1 extracellular solute-binding protein [Streptomyces sp. NBC_00869]WSZ27306.1 extracellular solute-binding protein [Streptomyces sp. NBC_00870]